MHSRSLVRVGMICEDGPHCGLLAHKTYGRDLTRLCARHHDYEAYREGVEYTDVIETFCPEIFIGENSEKVD